MSSTCPDIRVDVRPGFILPLIPDTLSSLASWILGFLTDLPPVLEAWS
jgi:hypothetical protein